MMRTVLRLIAVLAVAGTLACAYVLAFGDGRASVAARVALVACLGALGVVLASLALLQGPRRDLVLKAWLAIGATALAYVGLDLIGGQLLIRPLSPPLMPDVVRHHKLVPSSQAEFRNRDYAYIQHVNSLGLRGPEIPLEKPAGTVRVLMLGDSFTMGKGVEDDQTFSVLLDRRLADSVRACGGPRVEVVNAGVDSYAPVLEALYLRTELHRLTPDVVVVNLDVSDLMQEQAYRAVAERGPDGAIGAVPQRPGAVSRYEKVRGWTERNLFLTRIVVYYLKRAIGTPDVSVRGVVNEASYEVVAHTLVGDVDRSREWADVFASIREMQRFADSAGIGFAMTHYPWAHQVSDTQWVPGRRAFLPRDARPSGVTQQTVNTLAAARGIPLIDAFPAFAAGVTTETLYYPNDAHWTAAGHRVMADVLEAALLARYGALWCRSGGD